MKRLVVLTYDKAIWKEQDYSNHIQKLKEEGYIIAIYTSLTFPIMKRVLNNIAYDYLILSYGAVILDYKNDVWKESHIHPNVARRISKDLHMFASVSNFQIHTTLEDATDYDNYIIKLTTHLSNSSEIAEITRFICNKYKNHIHCYSSNHDVIDIVPKKVTLQNILYDIILNQEIDKNEIYLIGTFEKISLTDFHFAFIPDNNECQEPEITYHKMTNITSLEVEKEPS